jgi:hypothetical protein
MKKPTRVVFLDSREGIESLFTRGLRTGAIAAGWDADVVFLADADGALRDDKAVRGDLLERRPDTICFLMDAPLHLPRLWEAPSLAGTDKISLWFDDYQRSPKTLAHPEIWTDWQHHHGVRVGIWDGYWRSQWNLLARAPAFPVRLAADPQLYSPAAAAWKPAWKDRAAFVGTIPSLASLAALSESFPGILRQLLEDACEAMRTAAWPFRPYEIARECQARLGPKQALAVDGALQSAEIVALWHHLLWRWGQRIARLRGLAAVAPSAPLAIMSGHNTEAYADEAELRAALPAGTDLVYADTRLMPARSWPQLFRTGKFQVQITDPQSVEGGLPFRVFECAACATPLLSDARPELAEIFPDDLGVTLAADEPGLAEAAARLMAMPARELRAQGRVMHRRFLADHTWEVRWSEIACHPGPRPEVTPLASVSWKPSGHAAEPLARVA